MLDLFIERSSEHPLEVTINLVRDEEEDIWDELWEQTYKIFPLVSRWRSLLVSGTIREDVFSALLGLAHVTAPLLEIFEVKIESSADEEEDNLDETFLIFRGGAPKLTQIELREISITACQPPLSSIVSLRLCHPPHPYNIDQYREILIASHNLTNLELVGDIIDTAELYMAIAPRRPLTSISSLRSLTISPSWSMRSFTLYSVLASIDTPALEHLTLNCCPWQNHISEFQEIFRNYGPPPYPLLQSLTLRYANFSQPGAMWFTSMLPSIRSISLVECISPGRFLSLLLDGDAIDGNNIIEEPRSSFKCRSGSVQFPQLFDIRLSSIDFAGLHVLCDIISQRISRGIPIASLQFGPEGINNIPMDKLEWLRRWVRVRTCELY